MRRLPLIPLLAVLAPACQSVDPPEPQLTYPIAHKGNVVDDYDGTKVPDPYRWMDS